MHPCSSVWLTIREESRHLARCHGRGLTVDRTELLTAASSKLAEVVVLLTAAGEEGLAAHAEDLAQQVELVLEGRTPPDTTSH
jgi:hypothetical protein